jgi:hypothetical protein
MKNGSLLQKGVRCSVVLVTLVMFTAASCQSTIGTLTATLGNAAASIATVEGNATLAAKLKVDTAAAVSAVSNWKSGTPAQDAIEALNLVEDDLNLFPVASAYTPLIDLAIGTVESILALLPQSSTPTLSHHVHRSVTLTEPAPKSAAEFKSKWNAIVKSHPEMSQTLVK